MVKVKQQEKDEWDMQCYGRTQASMRAMLDNDITAKITGDYVMVAASFLSNAQEELAMGYNEGARQSMNIAKFVLFNYVMKDED